MERNGYEGIPAFEGKARRELEEELALLRQFVADAGEALDLTKWDKVTPSQVLAHIKYLVEDQTSARQKLTKDILLAYLNGTPPNQWGDPLEAVKRARQIAELFESVP